MTATLRVFNERLGMDYERRDMATSVQPDWPVALVTMPFISITRPSIQIGLLKAIADQHGFPTTTYHLNLDFASLIGPREYEFLCQHRGHLFGDWLFSLAAFGAEAPDQDDRLCEVFGTQLERLLKDVDHDTGWFRDLRRREVPGYLDSIMESIDWEQYKVVGFTSTFQQTTASIALAARIKERSPDTIIVFGGANLEGNMGREFVRSVPVIDYAVTGEGDNAFPLLLAAIQQGRPTHRLPNVVGRNAGGLTAITARPPSTNLDALPVPNYQEYFERAEALHLLTEGARRSVYLPFESARGCWWGQKNHCTFCGLNGADIHFRSKQPDRVIDELAELSQRYRSYHFEAVDNILDLAYLDKFFPKLRERQTDYQFFYEVKSNLTRAKIKALSDGGVRQMQPGIESLNSHILKLMSKGVTAIQNVNTLRWGLYYGVRIGWNLIWGFPGETPDDIRAQRELLSRIPHLQPPGGAGRIWMERYSPIFNDREKFPARSVQPEASYAFVYPPSIDLQQIAYFFDYELENTLPDDVYEETVNAVRVWQDLWKSATRPTLRFWSSPGSLLIEDFRDPAHPGTYTFTGDLASIYCGLSDQPHSARELKSRLEIEWSEAEIGQALDEFCDRGLMMRDGNHYLSLALPATGGR